MLQLLAAALQQNKASIFVNVTPLMLKGGDSRLKLLPFEIFVVLGQIEALRDNDLVPNANLFSYIHISCSI